MMFQTNPIPSVHQLLANSVPSSLLLSSPLPDCDSLQCGCYSLDLMFSILLFLWLRYVEILLSTLSMCPRLWPLLSYVLLRI